MLIEGEPWARLLPVAVMTLLLYPIAILFTVIAVFFYAMKRWRKLWIRELVGFVTYFFRDSLFFFR